MKTVIPHLRLRATLQHTTPQRGVALVIALILLVVMTLIGLAGLRAVTLEEKMTANTYDRSLSFQSTESALREAEAIVAATVPTPVAGTSCANGVCGAPTAADTPRWENSAFTGWRNASTVTSGSINITPQYIIEYMGGTFPCTPGDSKDTVDCKRYRITARSNAGDGRAMVILQSTYGTE